MIRIESEASRFDNSHEVLLRLTNDVDYKNLRDFIKKTNDKYNIGIEANTPTLKSVRPETETPEKPKGMIYVLNGNSMLDIAKQIINAVEFAVDIPTGLAAINFNKDRAVSDKLNELIDYLRINAEWRD